MRRTISLVALLLPAAAALAAQDKPDFSGRWVLEKPSQAGSDIPRALSVRQSLVRTNVRGEPMKPFFKDMAVEREFESGTYHETFPIGVVGGQAPGLREDGSRKVRGFVDPSSGKGMPSSSKAAATRGRVPTKVPGLNAVKFGRSIRMAGSIWQSRPAARLMVPRPSRRCIDHSDRRDQRFIRICPYEA